MTPIFLLSLLLTAPASAETGSGPTSTLTEVAHQSTLKDLCLQAHRVAKGQILTSRDDIRAGMRTTVASLEVDEILRGRKEPLVEVRTGAELVELADPLKGPGRVLVPGYQILVFMDSTNTLLDGGVWFVAAGHAWRNKTPGVFLNPRIDRDWVDNIDPTHDYDVVPLETIRMHTKDGTSKRYWRRLERKARRAAAEQARASD
jgi:hypothetical protein